MHCTDGVAALCVVWLCAWSIASAHGEDCDGRYFAPDDVDNRNPLKRPHAQLEKTIRLADTGMAEAQRSLAVSYESGYLVSRCPRDAARWYRQAALAGDKIAVEWVARNEQLDRLRGGPECVGQQCGGPDRDDAGGTSFASGPNGHFFAPVTINGVTLRGMIDTGASTLAMSREAARKFGIDASDGRLALSGTANGNIVNTEVVLPQVTVGGLTLRDVRTSIGISGGILIGMSFLSRFNIQMDAGRMTLTRR